VNNLELVATACGALAVIAIAVLAATSWVLAARIKTLSADYAALEQKFMALGEHNQRELMAIGQRVLEADKIVRRFSERLDGIENNHASDQPQYGQLQELLAKASMKEGDVSAAEVELLSLLTRNQKAST
jgi:hypothetical protein